MSSAPLMYAVGRGAVGGGMVCCLKRGGAHVLSSYNMLGFSTWGNNRNDSDGNKNPIPQHRVLKSPKFENISRTPPPRVWSAKKFNLRQNAVTVFPGDYHDNEDLKEGAERDWKGPEISLKDTQDSARARALEIQAIMQKEELELQKERQKKIDQFRNPPPHEVRIDSTGKTNARGTRKTAVARVWLQPGLGEITVNKQEFSDYFIRESLRDHILEPFVITETLGQFDITAYVHGGGHSGQAGAIRLAVARCLNFYNPDLYRPPLKFKKLLARDARMVERKKIGLLKSRKAPAWVKR